MKHQAARATAFALVTLALCASISLVWSQNSTISYRLVEPGTSTPAYTLNIVVPQTLLEYYEEKDHAIHSYSDFSKFVTPYSVKPIADCLLELYKDDEDFVNAALSIVHQMIYVETAPGSYPVETLVNSKGDCDIFSFLASSIISTAGFDVVLFYYEEEKHMNIGIHLASPPENTRTGVYKFTYEGLPYYIAECTGGNWTTGWRVGECPENLKSATAQILKLSNAELVSPGQVSASFAKLADSELLLEVSPPFTIEKNAIVIRGTLTPNKPDENITIYLGINGQPWQVLGKATTLQDGSFEYAWKSGTPGMYGIRASWGGDKTYAGSTSHTINAAILPLYLTLLVVGAIAAVVVGLIVAMALRHTSQSGLEPREPQVPSLE